MATFVFYYNGGNVNKRFTREFLLYVLDTNLVKHHINWDQSGRKRLIVTSRSMADRLLHVNQQVYWPNGELFKCKLIENSRRERHRLHQHYHHDYHRNRHHHRSDNNHFHKSSVNSKENTNLKNIKMNNDENYDWYTNGFVDIKLCGDETDTEENMSEIRQDINELHLNK